MEALCLGTPVIGSDIRGTRDLLESGGGITFPVGDIPKLTEAIRFIIDQPEKAVSMGATGRESMDAFSLQKVMELHKALYARTPEGR